MKSIKDTDIEGKKVLIRVDFNVPVSDGAIADDTRIKNALPTIQHVLDNGGSVILMTHFGRPKGEVVEKYRVNLIAEELERLLNKLDSPGTDQGSRQSNYLVQKIDDCIGTKKDKAVQDLQPGEVLLLENTRFHKEEKENDPEFSKQLAEGADIFVFDAFGAAHRAHASTVGVRDHLPTFAGLLLGKELDNLLPLTKGPEGPVVLIMGGAKLDTKIGVIQSFLGKADHIIVGGGIANTFLYAQGLKVGESLYQEESKELVKNLILEAEDKGTNFLIPTDIIVGHEISDDAEATNVKAQNVEDDMKIFDLGEETLNTCAEVIKSAKTIIWNGPVGLYEFEPYMNGTRQIAKYVSESDAKSYLGGGDTIDAIKNFGYSKDDYTFLSTGGGAMLELLSGEDLPGVVK